MSRFFAVLGFAAFATAPTLAQRTIDLSQTNGDIRVQGATLGDILGFAVAHGDFNGDGRADLIVGSPGSSPSGRNRAGQVFVFLGRRDFRQDTVIDLASASPDVRIQGAGAGDLAGSTLAAGDINSDGLADLIIGAPRRTFAGRVEAGTVYVVNGLRNPAPGTVIDLLTATPHMTILGALTGDRLGHAVAWGRLNQDAIGDLVASAIGADPAGRTDAGTVHAFWGVEGPGRTIDLAVTAADLTVRGALAFDRLGARLAVGDVTTDLQGDLVMGAAEASPGGRLQAGEVHVLRGGSFPAQHVQDLFGTPADVQVLGAAMFDSLGFSVDVADVTGDSFGDLVLGAAGASTPSRPLTGKVYVVAGVPSGPQPRVVDLLSAVVPLTVVGATAFDFTGTCATASDVTGDGVTDLIIGAPANYSGRGGRAYILAGAPMGPGTFVDLATANVTVIVLPGSRKDDVGMAVAAADVNDDAVPDVILGASGARPHAMPLAGETFVLFGGPLRTAGPFVPGGRPQLAIDAPWEANRIYQLVLAASDRTGIYLTSTRRLPVDLDSIFIFSILGGPLFTNFAGTLDAQGRAVGQFTIPGDPSMIGVSIYGAFVNLDPVGSPTIRTISNRVVITVRN